MKNSFFLRSPGTLFKIKNLIFVKILATVPGSVVEIKRFKEKPKLHALEEFFFRGGHPLNYLMHDPGLYGKGLR
jgi:hypothetical protein